MTTGLLVQILVIAAIVAVIYLIVALSRLQGVIDDAKEITGVTAKRIRELDKAVDSTEERLKSASDAVRGFVYSLDFIKIIRDKIMKEKREEDDGKK